MKRLQKFCCCASTRTGTLFTAGLGIILSILTIILLWIAPKNLISFSTFILSKEQDKQLSDLHIPQIVMTVSLCFTILICIFLIVGVKKRRSWFMLPFIVLGLVLAIGLLISILHTSITNYLIDEPDEDRKHEYTIMATFILVGGIIYLCLFLYAWAVVFSHYLDIRDEEERGRYRKAPYRR